ncbi:MAG: ATP-binding protein [Dysosmobacter sp.]
MKLRMLENQTLELVDCGIGAAASRTWSRPGEPLFTTGGEERSGMGFTIMESFMDQLAVKSAPGKGTTVTMRKRIALPVSRR